MNRLYLVLLVFVGGFLFACSHSTKTEESPIPFKLHISDGRVYLESSHHHLVNDKRGTASDKWNSFVYFSPFQNKLTGNVWALEGGPYDGAIQGDTFCEIKAEKSHYDKSNPQQNPVVSIKVRVKDPLEEGPFDTVINGESEGEFQFGEYPLRDWKAIENLTLDETLIPHWSYSKKNKLYSIVKKMGENRFLKKEIKVGHQVRNISSVKYEILEQKPTEPGEPVQYEALARLWCGASL